MSVCCWETNRFVNWTYRPPNFLPYINGCLCGWVDGWGGMLLFEPPMEVFNESFNLGEIEGYKKKFMYIKIKKETKTHVFGRTVMYVCVCA